MKRMLLATAGILLAVAPPAAPAAFAQDGRQRGDRGQQGQWRDGDRGPRGRNPGADRPDAQRPQPRSQPQQAQPQQAQPSRPADNGGRGYRPGDDRRVWPNQPSQAAPQRQDPRIDRGPAERRNDPRWTDRRPADPRRVDPRFDGRRDDRRDDRRWDNRWNDNRRWSPNGYFGNGPRWIAPQRYRLPAYRPPVGFGFRAWTFGQVLPPAYFSGNYVLNDFWNYGLPAPPPGTFWVRSGPDALLVERGSGYIIEVAADLFW